MSSRGVQMMNIILLRCLRAFSVALIFIAFSVIAGCFEEPIDKKEVFAAEALAYSALRTPSAHKIHVSLPGTVPPLTEGWCPADKLRLSHLLSAKQMHIFRVECGEVAPFEIRVDYKGTVPLLYADPLATKSEQKQKA
jgi:hypothetical protein